MPIEMLSSLLALVVPVLDILLVPFADAQDSFMGDLLLGETGMFLNKQEASQAKNENF